MISIFFPLFNALMLYVQAFLLNSADSKTPLICWSAFPLKNVLVHHKWRAFFFPSFFVFVEFRAYKVHIPGCMSPEGCVRKDGVNENEQECFLIYEI